MCFVGDLSFRGWFTNALANVFSKKAHDHSVCDMLKEVSVVFHFDSVSNNTIEFDLNPQVRYYNFKSIFTRLMALAKKIHTQK